MEKNRYLIDLRSGKKTKEELLLEIKNKKLTKVAKAIITMINNDLVTFDYDGEVDFSYLCTAIELLDEIAKIANHSSLSFSIDRDFAALHNDLQKIVSISDNSNNIKYKCFLKAIEKLEKNTANYSYHTALNQGKNYGAIVFYVLFDLKDYSLFSSMLHRHNKLINVIDKNDQPLIQKVIWRYLIAIKNFIVSDNINDLLFFKKVYKRIISNNKLRLCGEERNAYINLVNSYFNQRFNYIQDERKKRILANNKKILLDGLEGKIIEEDSKDIIKDEYDITDNFSQSVNNEATKIYILNRTLDKSAQERRIYTFDHNPNEIDDGISVVREDGLLIAGVHIADPLKYIDSNSILLEEARKRTESIYFSNNGEKPICIPMMPLKLSQDLMGLNAGKSVNVMSYYYYFDENTGALVDKRLECREEIIQVYKNYDYSDYKKIIDYGTNEEVVKDLLDMTKVASFMGRVYNDDMVNGLLETNSISSKGINVVTNFMIYNNISMARKAKEKDIPYVFRNHILDKDRKKINNIKSKVMSREPVTSIFKLLDMLDSISPRATYSSNCVHHDALAVDAYSHTTSPLRRYVDILNIECIKKFIINDDYTNEDIKVYKEYICKAIEEINARKKVIGDYASVYEKRLMLQRH